MTVAGKWIVTLDGPTGPQELALTLKQDGSSYDGTLYSELLGTTLEVSDIATDGDTLTWNSRMTSPITLDMSFTAKVDGDRMSGETTAGDMGTFNFAGVRG